MTSTFSVENMGRKSKHDVAAGTPFCQTKFFLLYTVITTKTRPHTFVRIISMVAFTFFPIKDFVLIFLQR